MEQLLQELKDTKVVKVTGSFADGTQGPYSDIDFYVKEDKPDTAFRDRNILKVLEVLQRNKITWSSTEVGYIFTHKSLNPRLERQLEFSDRFDHRPNRLPEVTIDGITFKTH